MSQPDTERVSFAVFTEPHEVEESFEIWPQHLTVFPPVFMRREIGKSVLQEVTANTYAFDLELGEAGELSNHRVRFFEAKRSVFMAAELHKRVFNALQARRGPGIVDLAGTEYIGKSYLPHISQKKNQPKLKAGQEIRVDHLALVALVDTDPDIQQIMEINSLKNG